MNHRIKRILLVDDEERLLNSMTQRLSLLGFEALKASSGTEAIEIVSRTRVDLAIVDLNMPDMDGLSTITRLKEIAPDIRTVLLTGYGSEKTRHETKQSGSDYFEKDSMGDLWDLIRQFSNQTSDHPAARGIADSIGTGGVGDLPKIIGETSGMQRLRKDINRLSGMDCTVMIRGEEGTGKELAARTIHRMSHRKDQRFLAFNCGCFSNDFNFTDLLCSVETSSGYAGLATMEPKDPRFVGTILLDHFETMPVQTQQDMLRYLDRTTAVRSPDQTTLPGDIRFIIASPQDLNLKIDKNEFSKDLYQRLNAISIAVPPLRERRDDITPLCSYFLTRLNKEFEKDIESISDEVFSIFMNYPFPGNVRELRHIIERAVILAGTYTIEVIHLPDRLKPQNSTASFDTEVRPFTTLEEVEKMHILEAVKRTQGNRTKAAEILGISRAALWRKLKMFNAESSGD